MAYQSNLAHKDDRRAAIEQNGAREKRLREAANDNVRYGEAANDPSFRDTSRGIQKVVVTPRNPSGEYVVEENSGPRVQRFLEIESIAARAKNTGRQGAANEADEGGSEERTYLEETARRSAVDHLRLTAEEKLMKRVAAQRALESGFNSPKLKGFSFLAGVAAVWKIYFIQFILAMISLAGFGIAALVEYYTTETTAGKVISWFVDINNYIPADYIAIGFWALVTILSLATFIAFTIWYFFIGINPFKTVISSFLTMIALALSMIPVLNLLPWLPFWVMYMDTLSVGSVLHLFENG